MLDTTSIAEAQPFPEEKGYADGAPAQAPSCFEGTGKSRSPQIFLERLKIDSFGVFTNKMIGPFCPGLNVVFGKNEAGKTTLNAFFGGILFGWEEARGSKNTYKPKNAERSGSLFFVDADTEEEFVLSRSKNSAGLQGPAALVDDIEKDTYATMFALTSDELRSLRNTTEVTAKLLTAGSGTAASPAQAQAELQARISEYTSKAAGLEHSFVQLDRRQTELRAAIAEATAEADRYKRQDKEFHEIAPQREELLARLETINTEIEALTSHKAGLEKLQVQFEKSRAQREGIIEEERALAPERLPRESEHPSALSHLDQRAESALRDRIDNLSEEQAKLEQRLSVAKDTYTESKAAYEALLEADDMQELEQKVRSQRKSQVVLSIALPLLFVVVGVPAFIHGRDINSLSFTALGIFLILFAVLLAGAALVMLFRPNKSAEALEQRKNDAQWVMLQDKKKFEACNEDLDHHQRAIGGFLEGSGLAEAHGSLRRARAILDEVREERAHSSLISQKRKALVSQLSSLDEVLSDLQGQQERIYADLSMDQDAGLADIEALIRQKVQQRATLTEASGNVNRRFGELKQELSQAKTMRGLDELKLNYQQVRTRLNESAQEYARLLLAKRMLEVAISAWESKSQPEVYKQASRLLTLMTKGRWVQVKMTQEGRLEVVDKVKTTREPTHLSLSTCQQLYLSLRVALLMTADNVGRIIPILADDILVNFDAERREGAVRVLMELATKRQVIFFTSHEEIVRLMQSADAEMNVLEL